MANIYVRSTDGNDADNGSTWALAKATLSGALAIAVAGDTVYVSQVHAETQATAMTLTSVGTSANPVRILCASDAAEPPTALATTATVTTTGASSLTINGGLYCYGITFSAASGAGTAHLEIANASGVMQLYESCSLRIASTDAGSYIRFGATPAGTVTTRLLNSTFRFGHAFQRVYAAGNLHIVGGSTAAGGSSNDHFIDYFSGKALTALVENYDFTNNAAALKVTEGDANATASQRVVFRNCKLPASWSGSLVNAAPATPAGTYEMYNCASGDTNYALWMESYYGSVRHETTIVRTGGASDGTTPLSWKMATTANANYPVGVLKSGELGDWIESVGSSKTVTVEIIHDSVTALNDDEVWVEVNYLGTSGFPLGINVSDAKANVLAAAAAQTTSSETWTTTGLTNPNKQKLAVTFTPQEKGYYIARVCLAKPSKTVYVCPKATVT